MFRRPILLFLLLLGTVLAAALLAIGAFPPGVTPTPVERVIPNDRFTTR